MNKRKSPLKALETMKWIMVCAATIIGLMVTAFAQGQGPVTTKAAIQEAQQRLHVLGYEAGPADGTMGSRTVSALKKFQADNGLAITGALDQKTLGALSTASPAALQTKQGTTKKSPDKVTGKDITIRGKVATSGVQMSQGYPFPWMTLEGHSQRFMLTPQQGQEFGIIQGGILNTTGWNVEIVFQQAAPSKEDTNTPIKSFKRLDVVTAPAEEQPVAHAGEPIRDGRFVGYENGTVLDSQTKLLWAAKDNGRPITWAEAKSYCETYATGGWRMPTKDELSGLYDQSKTGKIQRGFDMLYIHVATTLIKLTSPDLWAVDTRSPTEGSLFRFGFGQAIWVDQAFNGDFRVLPVHSER